MSTDAIQLFTDTQGDHLSLSMVGGKKDAVHGFDGSITAGTNKLTSAATVVFQSSDVGKIVKIPAAGPTSVTVNGFTFTTQSSLAGKISSLADAGGGGYRSAILTKLDGTALTAGNTVSGGDFWFGTDNKSALTALLANSRYAYIPRGSYMCSGTVPAPAGARVFGASREIIKDLADVPGTIYFGSNLVCADDTVPLFSYEAPVHAYPPSINYSGWHFECLNVFANQPIGIGAQILDSIDNSSQAFLQDFSFGPMIENCSFFGHYSAASDSLFQSASTVPTVFELQAKGGIAVRFSEVYQGNVKHCFFTNYGLMALVEGFAQVNIEDNLMYYAGRFTHLTNITCDTGGRYPAGTYTQGDSSGVRRNKCEGPNRLGGHYAYNPSNLFYEENTMESVADQSTPLVANSDQFFRFEGNRSTVGNAGVFVLRNYLGTAQQVTRWLHTAVTSELHVRDNYPEPFTPIEVDPSNYRIVNRRMGTCYNNANDVQQCIVPGIQNKPQLDPYLLSPEGNLGVNWQGCNDGQAIEWPFYLNGPPGVGKWCFSDANSSALFWNVKIQNIASEAAYTLRITGYVPTPAVADITVVVDYYAAGFSGSSVNVYASGTPGMDQTIHGEQSLEIQFALPAYSSDERSTLQIGIDHTGGKFQISRVELIPLCTGLWTGKPFSTIFEATLPRNFQARVSPMLGGLGVIVDGGPNSGWIAMAAGDGTLAGTLKVFEPTGTLLGFFGGYSSGLHITPVSGLVFVNGSMQVGEGAVGTVQLVPGDASNVGHLDLYNPAGTRISYLGYGAGPDTMMNLVSGNFVLAGGRLGLASLALLGSPISGLIEYDGTSLYYTDSTSTRHTVGSGTIPTFTTGSIPFSNSSGVLTEDNSRFQWDDISYQLMVGASGNGQVYLVSGDATNAGHMDWYTPGAVRFAYLGFGTANLNLTLVSADFVVTGGNILLTGGSEYLQIGGSGIGQVRLNQGDGTNAGFAGFYNPAGTRFAYIGYGTGPDLVFASLSGGNFVLSAGRLRLDSTMALLGSPVAGALELVGTVLYYTDAAATRHTVSTGSGITSVFGRSTSAIVAAAGDYTAAQVTGALDAANNLNDVVNPTAARNNLLAAPQTAGIGGTIHLFKLTTGGANGSIVIGTQGNITSWTNPT